VGWTWQRPLRGVEEDEDEDEDEDEEEAKSLAMRVCGHLFDR
jgi:hypothetical protein